MYKKILVALAFLSALPAFAQFTQVSGTVHDAIGIPYANGTITAVLNISGSPFFTATGQAYTPPTGLVQLDSNGNFTMQLAQNSALSPGGSTWSFITCSVVGTVQPSWGRQSACFIIGPITISGSSQDISVQIQNHAWPLTYSASVLLQASPAGCPSLFGPVDADFSNLDSTGLATVKPSPANSGNVIGIAVWIPLQASCIGTVQVATGLVVPCVTDNQSAVGDAVIMSGSTPGQCSDAGAVPPISGSFGVIMRANTGSGTISMILLTLGGGGGGGGGGGTVINCPVAVNGSLAAFNNPTTLNCDQFSLTDFAGNLTFQSGHSIGPFNGEYQYTSIGVVPPVTLPAATETWTIPNVVPTSFRNILPPAPCTVGQFLADQSNTTDGTGTINVNWNCSSITPGSGTVTGLTVGNLAPLFTSNVATPTTTPAVTYTLSNAGAHLWYGNNTGSTAAPAFEAITSPDLPVGIQRWTCVIRIGADNGAVLVNGDLGPQTNSCKAKAASTISEITLSVNNTSSTTSVQLQKRHCSTFSGGGSCTAFTTTNLLSAVLPAAAVGNADACAKASISQTCIDGTTSSGTVTVSTTALGAGDWIETTNASAADGSTTRVTITVTSTVN